MPHFKMNNTRALLSVRSSISDRDRVFGFTLIELLVVIAIMAAMVGLLVPVMNAFKNASDLTKASYDIQGALTLARTYAVANNTYTWVGFFEEDASQPSQTPAVSGVGRLVISVVASSDGTSVYSQQIASSGTTSQVIAPGRLTLINKLTKINNIHILAPPASGDAFGKRPGAFITSADQIGLSNGSTLFFQFQYPLAGTAQYIFGIRPAPQKNGLPVPSGVVQFNPRGEVVSDSGPFPGVSPCKEIAIQATRGTTPDAGVNIAAIDISGLTGQATIYRR